MIDTKYFKAVTDKGTKFYAVNEDENLAGFYLEDMEADNVHIDMDSSWHFHDYDLDLLDNYEPEDVISLLKVSKDANFTNIVADLEDMKSSYEDWGSGLDIENIKDYLNQTLSYTGAYALYRAVNNDLANTIKAFTVSGYAQGESAFIWYDTKDTENAPLYTEDYIESVLYATWYAIDTVDEHGDYIDSVDVVTYSDYDNSYMLKRFKAVPAATATLLTIL